MDPKRIRKIKSSLLGQNYKGVLNLLDQFPPIPINFENNWIFKNIRRKYTVPTILSISIIQKIWDNFSKEERDQHYERITSLAMWAEEPSGQLPFLEKLLEDGYRPSFYYLCTFRTFDNDNVELVNYLSDLLPKNYDLEKEISQLVGEEMTSNKIYSLFQKFYLPLTIQLFFIKNTTLLIKIPLLAEKLSVILFDSYYHNIDQELFQKCLSLMPRLSKATVVQTIFRTAPENIGSCREYNPTFSIAESTLLKNQVANLEIENETVQRNTEILFRYNYTLKDIYDHYTAGEYQCVTTSAFDDLVIYTDPDPDSNEEQPHQQYLSTKVLKKIVTDMFIDYHFAFIHLSWQECIQIFYHMCPWFQTFCEEHLTSKLFQIHTKTKNKFNNL